MTRTERADLVLDIARRVQQEAADGRPVAAERLEWAE